MHNPFWAWREKLKGWTGRLSRGFRLVWEREWEPLLGTMTTPGESYRKRMCMGFDELWLCVTLPIH